MDAMGAGRCKKVLEDKMLKSHDIYNALYFQEDNSPHQAKKITKFSGTMTWKYWPGNSW